MDCEVLFCLKGRGDGREGGGRGGWRSGGVLSEGSCIYLVHAGHRLEAGTLGTLAACRRELTYSRRRSSGGQGKDTHTHIHTDTHTHTLKRRGVSGQDKEGCQSVVTSTWC